MQKTSLLLIVVLIIVVLAGGGFYFWYQNNTAGTANVNVTETNVNLSTTLGDPTITNDNWEPTESGDVALNVEKTYKDVTFRFTTAATATSFHGLTAAEGKKYIIVYFRDIPLAQRDAVTIWLRNDVRLSDSGGDSYDLGLNALITEYSGPTETGYFQFTVPESASGFTLTLGEGDGSASVSLGL